MYASIIFFVFYGIFCEKSRVSVPQKTGEGRARVPPSGKAAEAWLLSVELDR